MMFTEKQLDELAKPIDPKRVSKDNKGFSHLEAWDVRRRLTEIFGFGGWSTEIRSCDLVSEEFGSYKKKTWKDGKEVYVDAEGWTVVYRVHASLVIGRVIFEDVAVGGAVNQPSLVDAHDNAAKSAASGALKRCAVNLGDQFGLSLYNNGSTRSVVHIPHEEPEPTTEPAADVEPVVGFEKLILSIGSAATVDTLKELYLKYNEQKNSFTETQWAKFSKAVSRRKEQLLAQTAEAVVEETLDATKVE